MLLKEYLTKNKIQSRAFAAFIGTSAPYMSVIISRRVTPSLDLAILITSATFGIVSYEELLADPAKKISRRKKTDSDIK